MGIIAQASSWITDIHNVISIAIGFVCVVMSVIGYGVHKILFNMKIPERIAILEHDRDSHERRLRMLERTVYKMGGASGF